MIPEQIQADPSATAKTKTEYQVLPKKQGFYNIRGTKTSRVTAKSVAIPHVVEIKPKQNEKTGSINHYTVKNVTHTILWDAYEYN